MEGDIIKGFEINSKGYGTVSKAAMQDSDLHIIAKGIYAYFCSFTGCGDCCFPKREKICKDLGISGDTLNKYVKQLVRGGYVTIEQVKENGRFSHNIYTLCSTILPQSTSSDTEDTVTESAVTEDTVTETIGTDSLDTNNNNIYKINNNKINNIKNKKKDKRKADELEEILLEVEDEALRETYEEFIKVRKAIRSPMTGGALKRLIKKVNSLEPDSVQRQKELLDTAIMNGWRSVYPLRDEKVKKSVPEFTVEDLKKGGGLYIE